LFSEEDTIRVVGQAAKGREAVDRADRLRPDVVIMDVTMPLIDGDDATRQIKRLFPRTRIIALSMYEEPETVRKVYQAGAERVLRAMTARYTTIRSLNWVSLDGTILASTMPVTRGDLSARPYLQQVRTGSPRVISALLTQALRGRSVSVNQAGSICRHGLPAQDRPVRGVAGCYPRRMTARPSRLCRPGLFQVLPKWHGNCGKNTLAAGRRVPTPRHGYVVSRRAKRI
jgi:CheY-like chemotaxis protein